MGVCISLMSYDRWSFIQLTSMQFLMNPAMLGDVRNSDLCDVISTNRLRYK